MKAAWYERNGSARDVLQVGEMNKPTVSAGEVLVRVFATSVNPSDTQQRSGKPLPPGVMRLIPHQDGAGVIEEVGLGVSSARVGERVWIYEALIAGSGGCAAEYVSVPSGNAIKLADHISFELGACLGVPALTAHRCVFADGPVTGKTVLVTGGGGAVGAHAIQFAKAGGAKVFTTASREEQAAVARAAGADLVINRHQMDVVSSMQEAAGAPGAPVLDRIVEVAFGVNLPSTMKLLKVGGTVAVYASEGKPEAVIPVEDMVWLDATVHFVLVYRMGLEAHESAIQATTKGLEQRWLKTTIASRFSLDQIAAAHDASESGKPVGKIVVLID